MGKKSILISFFLMCASISLLAQTIQYSDMSGGCYQTTAQTMTLLGSDGGSPVRNIYSGTNGNGNLPIRVIWVSGASRWEIQTFFGGVWDADYANTNASHPNPPALGVGTWTKIFPGCTSLTQFSIISALPIVLTRFEGNNRKDYNLLSWTTSSESQNKGFYIERSTDGVHFEKIGFLVGNGTTNIRKDYSFKDETPNGLVYYRLKQLDFDGRFEYSKIIAIDSKGEKVASVFPNPSTGIFTITGIEDTEDETFTLINSIGQTLSINVQNNGQVDMSAYPSSVYYLRVASNGQVMKLVKE